MHITNYFPDPESARSKLPEHKSAFPLLLEECISALLKGSSRSSASVFHTGQLFEVKNITINDPKDVTEGTIFAVAHKNKNDAQVLIRQAIENGAKMIVTGHSQIASWVKDNYPTCFVILSKNTLDNEQDPVVRGLRPLAECIRSVVSLPVLSISGTAGKTTTRDLATSILRNRLNVISTQKNDNNIWGTTRSLLGMNSTYDCAFYEFGSDGAGQTTFLSRLTKPNITYISSIGIAHIATVGGLDEMLKCETEQCEWMLNNSAVPPIFIANIDDLILEKYFSENTDRFCAKGAVSTVSATIGKNADYQLLFAKEYFENDRFFTHIKVKTPIGDAEANVPLIGQHNRANICGAIALTVSSGLCDLEDVTAGLEDPTFTGYRSDFFREPIGHSLILNDSFNSNPTGLTASMNMAVQAKKLAEGNIDRIILVLGDMWALGEQSPNYHIEMGQLANELGIDAIYCHGDKAKYYCQGFGDRSKSYGDKESLYLALRNEVLEADNSSGSLILVKGSPKTQTSLLSDWLRAGEVTA